MEEIKCPKCGSTHLQNKGKRANKRRFRCSECKTNFTEGVIYKPQEKYLETINTTCPVCGGIRIMRDGKLEDGSQRYICRDCNKRFSDKTNRNLKPIKWKCPYCGGELGYSGYGKLKQHEYKCKECGRSCSGKTNRHKPTKKVSFEELNTTIKCVGCGSMRIKSAGVNEKGEKRYICKECGKSFTEKSKHKPKITVPTIEMVEKIKEMILNGHSTKTICSTLGCCRNRVSKIRKEIRITLTKEQEMALRRYVGMLGLSIEDVCKSINIPLSVGKSYMRSVNQKGKILKAKRIKKKELTAEEKSRDKLELERF